MKLAHATWPEVDAFTRDAWVLIPTGSCEQHGAHLPFITDTLIATAVAEGAEKLLSDLVLLTPTLWLGASGHHLPFTGSLSASMGGYQEALQNVVESLTRHGFWRFFVINGHGGNTSLNDVALRELKEASPELMIGGRSYSSLIDDVIAATMEGPVKTMRHACEAETSLMLHLAPELVRFDHTRVDGLKPTQEGLIHLFDEITENGSWGHSRLGTAEKGRVLFEAAVERLVALLRGFSTDYQLIGIE